MPCFDKILIFANLQVLAEQVFFSNKKVWESELLVKEYNTEVANGWGGSLAAISLNQFLNSRHIWPTNCCFSP